MIRLIALVAIMAVTAICVMSQTTVPASNRDSAEISPRHIEMLFPEGKSKALILSYDDGPVNDRRLVKLMNGYHLKGTFHLNSNKLGLKDYITKEEVKELYKGHEVSVHTANHPNLTTLSKIDVTYEIVEDRRELERLTGGIVRGMAYPFGNYNEGVVETIRGLGIEYARTVDDTHGFTIPDDVLKWNPTIHQFGKAYSIPNDHENDRKEVDGFFALADKFLASDGPALFYVWGHSWEFNGSEDRWGEIEKLFKKISQNPDVCSMTNIGLTDYINAYRNLRFSVDKTIVTNPNATDVFVRMNGTVHTIAPGAGAISIE